MVAIIKNTELVPNAYLSSRNYSSIKCDGSNEVLLNGAVLHKNNSIF